MHLIKAKSTNQASNHFIILTLTFRLAQFLTAAAVLGIAFTHTPTPSKN